MSGTVGDHIRPVVAAAKGKPEMIGREVISILLFYTLSSCFLKRIPTYYIIKLFTLFLKDEMYCYSISKGKKKRLDYYYQLATALALSYQGDIRFGKVYLSMIYSKKYISFSPGHYRLPRPGKKHSPLMNMFVYTLELSEECRYPLEICVQK